MLAVTQGYSILSLDSARYKGYITARFVEAIENYTYTVAKSEFCDIRDSQKVHVTELFDMIAGSGTGAIIGTSLSIPSNKTD